MKYPRILMVCLGLLASLWLGTAQALPNVDEVQAAAQRGDYAGAEKMMREVVAAKPDSARAHYVLAEILAHQRQFSEASEHARRARSLDPAIKFTDAAKFSAFEQLLQREQAATSKALTPAAVAPAPPPRAVPAEPSGSGVPVWLLVVGVVVFIGVAVRWMQRRAAAQAQPALAGGYGAGGGMGGGMGGYGAGYGPGMPQAPSSGGPGMLGVGLGVAGGVAAGMLAERLLHGGQDERSIPRDRDAGGAGGLIPGSFGNDTDSASSELTRRDIDFGSGDGWDGGGGDAGGGGGDDW